jgi:hypothetical protein
MLKKVRSYLIKKWDYKNIYYYLFLAGIRLNVWKKMSFEEYHGFKLENVIKL